MKSANGTLSTIYPITVWSSRHGVGLMWLRLRVRFRASVVSRTFPITLGSRCGVGLSLQPPWRPHTTIGVRGPTRVASMRVMLKHLMLLCSTKCYWCGVHMCPPVSLARCNHHSTARCLGYQMAIEITGSQVAEAASVRAPIMAHN